MADEVLDADAVEEPQDPRQDEPELTIEAEVRPLPQRRSASELDAWRGEVRTVAIAAAGGLAAGAATVAVVNAIKARVLERKQPTRVIRRGGKQEGVLASRSFLVDVHLLDR